MGNVKNSHEVIVGTGNILYRFNGLSAEAGSPSFIAWQWCIDGTMELNQK
jgi:hypothetical protein